MDEQGFRGIAGQILQSGIAGIVNQSLLNTASMNFPSNLGTYPFWMSLSFYEYKRPKFTGSMNLINKNTIRLPLPNQLIDHQDVVYTQEEAGLSAGIAINTYMNNPTGPGAAAALGLLAGSKLVGADRLNQSRNAALLTQLGGVAVNPFLTVMFKSPAFRKHQLSWRLSPTNAKESQILYGIIETLRQNQLPGVSGSLGGALLTYPNIVQVSVSNPNTFQYRFKPAVIESLTFNFAPGGQPSFFGSTKTPTEVEIRISLLEIEYYLNDSNNREVVGPFAKLLGGLVNDALGAFGQVVRDATGIPQTSLDELNNNGPSGNPL